MMKLLFALLPFLRRRQTFGQRVGNRTSALARGIGTRRGGLLSLGTVASIAAPFIFRKLQSRRAQRQMGAAY